VPRPTVIVCPRFMPTSMFDSQPIQGLIMPVGMKMRFANHTKIKYE